MSRIVAAVVVAVVVVALLSRQSTGSLQTPAKSSTDDLLNEVRALRAELHQAVSASIRTQLLVARFQLQEQRFNLIARQLTETREEIAKIEQARAFMTAQLKPFGEMSEEAQKAFEPLKAIVEQGQQREQELRAREAELSAQLAAEQSRWSEFNDRLDAVERELQTRKPR
jgi:chromosome segregation ATPase